MKNRYIISSLLLLILISCSSGIKGSGAIVEKSYPLDDFEEFIIEGDFELILNQTSENSIVISIDENLTEFVILEESNEKVEISLKEQIDTESLPKIELNFKQLQKLYVSGNNLVQANGKLIFNDLEMDITGQNIISLSDMEVDEFILDNAGDTKFTISSGKCDELELEISGNAQIDFEKIEIDEMEIDATGAGVVKCSVSDEIDIDVDGEFEIYYTGNPKETLSTKGNSKVYKK